MGRRIKIFHTPDEHKAKPPPAISKADTRNDLLAKMSSAMQADTSDSPEDQMIAALDEKALIVELMREILPTFKKLKNMKDPESILMLGAPSAAKTLLHVMLFGTRDQKESAATKVLDRVIGKPVERKIHLGADLHKLSESEVKLEILRIVRKLGPEGMAGLLGAAPLRRSDIVVEKPSERGASS